MDINMETFMFCVKTNDLLNAISHYQDKMDLQLKSIHDEAFAKLETDWVSEEMDKESIWSFLSDDFRWVYEFMFPRSLRYSFLVLLFLVLEKQLIGLCDEIRKMRNLQLQVNELKGEFTTRCKTYLEKVAGVPPIDAQLWEYVEDLAKIRNCIVHTLGNVESSRDKERLQSLARKNIGISISDDELYDKGVIVISEEYCGSAVKNIREFFAVLFDAAGFKYAENGAWLYERTHLIL